MKRVITSATYGIYDYSTYTRINSNNIVKDSVVVTSSATHDKYKCYDEYEIKNNDLVYCKLQLSRISPYDLQEYNWFNYDSNRSEDTGAIIDPKGHIKSIVNIPMWDEDYYETVDDWLDYVCDAALNALDNANFKLKPIIDRT